MYCSKCGAKTVDGATFCSECGSKTNVAKTAEVTPPIQSPMKPTIAPVPVRQEIQPVQINPQTVAVAKKSSAKIIIFVIFCIFLLIGSGATAYLIARDKSESAVQGTASGNEGNTAQNLANGGLLADNGEWTFYSNPDLDGALCAIQKDGDAPIQLTDFPVANINLAGDKVYFTDIYGSYYIEKDSDGNDTYSYPDGEETLEGLLSDGEDKTIIFGGGLYVLSGAEKMFSDGDAKGIKVKKLDTSSSPAYSVSIVDGRLQYVYLGVTGKVNMSSKNSVQPTELSCTDMAYPQNLSGSYTDNSFEFTNQGGNEMTTRDRNDRALYWWGKIAGQVSSAGDYTKKWCARFGIFDEKTVAFENNGSVMIAQGPNASSGEGTTEVRKIEGSEGWSEMTFKGLPEIDGVSYIQVYKNKTTDSSVEVGEVQIWAVDRKTGKKLNAFECGTNMDMYVQGDSVLFKGKDGLLYETQKGEKPKAVSSMPVNDVEILYNGDIICSYDRGDGTTGEAVLSKNSYEKEAYNGKLPNDGVTLSEESGWYTHTNESKFKKVLPVKTYRGCYMTNRDGTVMEIYKNGSGKYSWYRVDGDGYTELKNLTLPPKFRAENEKNDSSEPDSSKVDDSSEPDSSEPDSSEPDSSEPESSVPDDSSQGEDPDPMRANLSGKWVSKDGEYTLILKEVTGGADRDKAVATLKLSGESLKWHIYEVTFSGGGINHQGYFHAGEVRYTDIEDYGYGKHANFWPIQDNPNAMKYIGFADEAGTSQTFYRK